MKKAELDSAPNVVNYNQTVNEYNGRSSQPPPYGSGGYDGGGYDGGGYDGGGYSGGGYNSGGHYGGDTKYPDNNNHDNYDIPDGRRWCDICGDGIPTNQLHHHCIVCNDGEFDVCQACKGRGHSCPGRHRLYQR